MLIVVLLILIVCILLFGAVAVRGALGVTLGILAAGLAIVPLLVWGERILGRDADLYIGSGIVIVSLAIWVATKLHDPHKAEIRRRVRRRDADKVLRELSEANHIRSEEERLQCVREAHDAVYRNSVTLSKAERKFRKEASRARGSHSLEES